MADDGTCRLPMVSSGMAGDLYEAERMAGTDAADTPLQQAASAVPVSRPAGHRLGPIVKLAAVSHPLWGRCYAAALAAMAGGVLLVAFSLSPGDQHMGTHRQLGLPPCGFVIMTGFPCPTCGMTTAFAFMTRGRVIEAFRAQAAGALLALATAAVAVMGAVCAVTGRYATLNWYRVNAARLIWTGTLVFVAAWAAKIALGLLDGTLPVQ